MEASSARRSARAGRAAQAFRSHKYPNEICSGVSDIHSVRAHTSDETPDRACGGVGHASEQLCVHAFGVGDRPDDGRR